MRQLEPVQLARLLQGWPLDATIHEFAPKHLRPHPIRHAV